MPVSRSPNLPAPRSGFVPEQLARPESIDAAFVPTRSYHTYVVELDGEAVGVGGRVDRDGRDVELPRGADDPNGDLTAVRDQ